MKLLIQAKVEAFESTVPTQGPRHTTVEEKVEEATSTKADLTYVNQDVDQSKGLFFNSLEELQSSYPNGLKNPVWIESENSWYVWEKDFYISYLTLDKNTSLSSSANWKGSITYVKQNIILTEIGASGLPQQWNLW